MTSRRPRLLGTLLACAALVGAGCATTEPPPVPELPVSVSGVGQPVRSLQGRELLPPPIEDAARLAELEQDLVLARASWEAMPGDEEAVIWYGRRCAYLYRYDDAIEVFTSGLALHPESSALRRHRGHRFITTRRLDEAVDDLALAAELAADVPDAPEPDGAPNPAGIPRSTNQSSIWYHLGLAYWLRGDFADALDAWEQCLVFSRVNDDMLVATSWWLYLARMREGRSVDDLLAPVQPEMDILENHAYHRLLLLAKGELGPEDLVGDGEPSIEDTTLAGGLANWHLVNGREAQAFALYERIVDGPIWMAFGHITAEAELARR